MKVYVGQYATGVLKGMVIADTDPLNERRSDELYVTLAEYEVPDVTPLAGEELLALCAEQNKEKIERRAEEQREKLEQQIAELEGMRDSFSNKALYIL